MKVSYVVPAFNCEATLDKCLESIQDQEGYKEIIVIIDGHNGELFDICFLRHVKAVTIPHSGAAVARNKGIELATGDLICLVDSDNILPPDYISKILQNDFQKWDIVTGQGVNDFVPKDKASPLIQDSVITLDNAMIMGMGAVFPSRMKNLFRYDEDFIVGGEDVALFYSLIEAGCRMKVQTNAIFSHVHKSKDQIQRVLQHLRRRVFFAYGQELVYLKFGNKRPKDFNDFLNNIWALPLVPFLLTYVRIKRRLNG